jgi:hypothetical protein
MDVRGQARLGCCRVYAHSGPLTGPAQFIETALSFLAGWTAVVIWHVAAILAVAFLLAAAPAGVLYGAGGLMLALFGVTGSGMLFMVGTCFFMGSWSI